METHDAESLVAANVRRAREERGLSQAELARLLGWVRGTVHKLETGQRGVRVGELVAIAAALHVAPVVLLTPWGEEEALEVPTFAGKGTAVLDGESAFGWLVGAADASTLLVLGVQLPNYFGIAPLAVQRRYGAELVRRLREQAGWEIADDGSYVARPGGISVRWSPDDQEDER